MNCDELSSVEITGAAPLPTVNGAKSKEGYLQPAWAGITVVMVRSVVSEAAESSKAS